MGSVTQFLYKKVVLVLGSSLFLVSTFLLPFFRFIISFLCRLHGNGGSMRQNFDNSEIISSEIINQQDFKGMMLESNGVALEDLKLEPDVKTDEVGFAETEDDCKGRKLELSFTTFRFPTFEEFSRSKKENSDLSKSESVYCTSYSKCDLSSKSYSGFVKEPEVLSYKNLEQKVTSDATEISKEQSKEKFVDDGEETDTNETGNHDLFNHAHFNYCEKYTVVTDGASVMSYNDGFLCDEDFGNDFKVDDLDADEVEHLLNEMSDDWDGDGESDDFGEEDGGKMDELSKLEGELPEQDREQNLEAMTSQFLSDGDFYEDSNEADKDDKPMNGSYDSEKLTSKETCDLEDSNKLETLWEDQDLIEQLKMELRKVRATGLPTILEESESPKITEDLKPWKIDDKFHREDCMNELHKFYKSYSERMRKFDIFNYQKMYAIGFLQMKDPLQSISSPKTSGPTLQSLLSQKFWQLKHKGSDNEPMIDFIEELQSDLEVVYVGQMCLSWEFLHWQYGRALDLWDSDPHGIHRYNEVAGEFQQFQVLMQRFIEDEHFQGPRVQYYIKRRCLLRNLLQVPVIREDKLKDKWKGRRGEKAEYVITSDMMVEIIEESIRILWRFVRADKDCSSAVSKCHKGTPAQLQNPGDFELLTEIRKILQKKERKLKDMVRGKSVILRRFRKCREDDSDHVLYFFSQVDMKLVYRVLNMTRITTDQLVWCHSKLSRISFENRKIQVEPSFLLFPC